MIASVQAVQIASPVLLQGISLQRMLPHNTSLQPTPLRGAAELPRCAAPCMKGVTRFTVHSSNTACV